MKAIASGEKQKVITAFLTGNTYDHIALSLGVSKGSVVGIIDDFRAGNLSLPAGMTEYVDELRKLLVDIKKLGTSVAQLRGYAPLHSKLNQAGVSVEQADDWLLMCQHISEGSVSSKQFVAAALELAKLTSANGMSYGQVMSTYAEKLAMLGKLDKDISNRKTKIESLGSQLEKEKKKAAAALASIKQTVENAAEAHNNHVKDLESKLEKYLEQNKLSWTEVHLAVSIFDSAFGKGALSPKLKKKIAEDICIVGSLQACIGQFRKKVEGLALEVARMAGRERQLKSSVDSLSGIERRLTASLVEKREKVRSATEELRLAGKKLARLKDLVLGFADVISITDLILGVLATPDVTDSELDGLVEMMISIRQRRLGIDPKNMKIVNGELVVECRIPKWYFEPGSYAVDMQEVRRKLATCLVPLVSDQFMPRREWDSLQLEKIISRLSDLQSQADSILAERRRRLW